MNDQNDKDTGDRIPEDTASETPTSDSLPIGFWLRTVDALITREFAEALSAEGVTRREWMLLNALAGDIDPALAERLARRPKRMRGLEARGWAEERGDGTWVLTDEGRAAKERLGAAVDGIRSRVAGAVSPEDFATTRASLESIARELGWDENDPARAFEARGFARGFGRGFRAWAGEGYGPGFRPGFGPGFRPGFGPGFRPGFDRGAGFGPGFRPGFGPGFRPGPGFDPRRARAEGWGDEDGCGGPRGRHRHSHHHPRDAWHAPHEAHDHGEHRHGEHRHGKGRARRDGERGAERAYERGFDAGYARGAAERG